MKRSLIISVLAFVSLSLIVGISVIGINGDGHNHASIQSKQELRAAVNGQTDPNLIPSDAAYEILFKLLSTGDDGEDKNGKIRSSYLKSAGFDEIESSALKMAAYEYKRDVAELNSEAKRLKDTHWPKPEKNTRDKLAQLQKEKEKVINRATNNLLNTPFFRGKSMAKLGQVINEKIKRKITAYSTELPPQKISFLDKLLGNSFVVAAQGCSAYIYLYADSWQGYYNVTGCSTTSESYNTCSHDVNQSVTVSGSGYTSPSGSDYTSLSLEQGSTLLDGNFTATATVEVTCTHTPGVVASNSAFNSTNVVPFIKFGNWGSWSSTGINAGVDTTIKITINCSMGASGVANGSWGVVRTAGNVVATAKGAGNITITPNATIDYEGTFHASSGNGKFKAGIDLSNVSGSFFVEMPRYVESPAEVTVGPSN